MGKRKPLVYEGKKYESIKQFERLNHLNHNKQFHKVLDVSFTKNYTVFGRGFDTLQEIADFYKLSFNQIRLGYFKHGFDLEDIINRLQKGLQLREKRTFDHLGNEFSSTKAMCAYYNISRYTFDKRKNKGLSLEECLTLKRWAHITRKEE
jgi:hypothetical protein